MFGASNSTFPRVLHMTAEVPVFICVRAVWALRDLRGRLVGKRLTRQPVRFEFVRPHLLAASFADISPVAVLLTRFPYRKLRLLFCSESRAYSI